MTRALTILTYWLAAVWTAQAIEVSIPEYRAGDVAGSDVVAPFEFAVVNSEQTERLRQQEVQKVAAVYRFYPWRAVQAEEKFVFAFNKTRSAFLESMEKAAGKRVLDDATIAHPSFARFVEWFKAQHPAFPVTTNLANTWALGEGYETVLFQLQSAIRDVMSRYVRADAVALAGDTAELQVIAVENESARLTLSDMAGKTDLVARMSTLTLAESREELTRRCADQGPEVGSFLATFLKENLSFDDWLTAQKRQLRAAELVVFDQYSPGQLVARTGQVIDTKTKAALDVLAVAVKRQQARAGVSSHTETEPGEVHARVLALWGDLQNTTRQHPWLLVIFTALAVVVLWRLLTSRAAPQPAPASEAYTVVMNPARNETVFLPVGSTSGAMSFDTPAVTLIQGGATGTPWQMQLREAEHRAEELLALVRAGLAPHLAKELTHKLVQELVCQRATLLRAHQLAEQEIVALEGRFEKVYRELQQRVETYEKRTADLEKELLAKGEQTRELMKATILLTQQKLETKKPGDEFACN